MEDIVLITLKTNYNVLVDVVTSRKYASSKYFVEYKNFKKIKNFMKVNKHKFPVTKNAFDKLLKASLIERKDD